MSNLIIDLSLSGITYVMLTYLTFVLMRKKKKGSDEGGDGLIREVIPIIDLPPGVSWPSQGTDSKTNKEEVFV